MLEDSLRGEDTLVKSCPPLSTVDLNARLFQLPFRGLSFTLENSDGKIDGRMGDCGTFGILWYPICNATVDYIYRLGVYLR